MFAAGAGYQERVRRLVEAENKRVVRDYLGKVCSHGRIEPLAQLEAAGTLSDEGSAPVAPATLQAGRLYRQLRRKLGRHLHLAIGEQIAEGNTVMTRLLATGTQREGVTGVPPEPRKFTRSLVLIHRFDRGRIAEERVFWDLDTSVRSAGKVESRKPSLATV